MLLSLILIVVLFVAVSTSARLIVLGLAREEFAQMPVFWRLSTLTGITVGVIALIATIAPEDRSLSAIFDADSYWAIDLQEWIARVLNPFALSLESGAQKLNQSPSGSGLALGVLPLLVAGYVFASLRLVASTNRRVRVLVSGVVWAFVTAWLVNGLASLGLWGVHHLNFWIFFAAIVFLRWPFVRLSFFRPGASTSEGAPKPR